MIAVYIAGPFRAPTPWEIEQNIRRAETLGLAVARFGCCPVIPHSQYRFFQNSMADEFWLSATLEQLRRCDAMILVEGWRNSSGTREELKASALMGMPVFEDLSKLERWVNGEKVDARVKP